MRMRRSRVVGVVAIGFAAAMPLAACGSDEGSTSSTLAPGDPRAATAVVLDPFYEVGGTDALATLVLEAGCAALSPVDRNSDSHTFNGDLYGLLSGGGPTFQGDGIRRDRAAVDRVIVDACAAHHSDPNAFLDQVNEELHLTAADMSSVIADACARFGASSNVDLHEPYAPEPFDLVPPGIVAVLGDDLAPAAMVDLYCGTGSSSASDRGD